MSETGEIAMLYCVKCRVCYPVIRPPGAESMELNKAGLTATECPGCSLCLVFGGVFQFKVDDPVQLIMDRLARDVEPVIDRLVASGASERPMVLVKRPRIAERKVVWTEEDEPMTEVTESFVEGGFIRDMANALANKIDADMMADANLPPPSPPKDEAEWWSSIGISFDGKVH